MAKFMTESFQALLASPIVDNEDSLAFSGDLHWIPGPYREAVHRIGTAPDNNEWRAKIERLKQHT